jgi:hypothetical protein
MTDYKTMRVPREAWEAAKAQKEEANRTWGEQIVRPDSDGLREHPTAPELDTERLAELIREEVDTDAPAHDDVHDALAAIEERTGRIERQLEELQR